MLHKRADGRRFLVPPWKSGPSGPRKVRQTIGASAPVIPLFNLFVPTASVLDYTSLLRMKLAIQLGSMIVFAFYIIRAGEDTERRLINFLIIVGSAALGVVGTLVIEYLTDSS